MFLDQFVLGGIMVCLTVIIHAVALDRLIMILYRQAPQFFMRFHLLWKVPMLTFAALGVFMAHIVQIWLWATLYLWIGALPNFEESLYFSTTTFTTLGVGDITLTPEWRLLSSFQGANGFLLFGWSTAFIFEVMSKLYERADIAQQGKK